MHSDKFIVYVIRRYVIAHNDQKKKRTTTQMTPEMNAMIRIHFRCHCLHKKFEKTSQYG